MAGGDFQPLHYSLVGSMTCGVFDRYLADVAFLGVDGVTLNGGLWAVNEREAEVKRHMIKGARVVVVLATHRKIGQEKGQPFATFGMEGDRVLKVKVVGLKDERRIKTDLLTPPRLIGSMREMILFTNGL